MKPLSPAEIGKVAAKKRAADVPPLVIQAINELLVEEHRDGDVSIRLNQQDCIARILKVWNEAREGLPGAEPLTRSDIFDNHYLDFEDAFREAGWDVQYAKQPYYVVDDDHFFLFKKP